MDCLFCKIVNGEIQSKIVYEDEKIISIMDVNPKAKGHILIIPKKHYKDYTEANDIICYMFEKANEIGKHITKALKQNGYSLIINYGNAQEIKHLHLHLVPNNNETEYVFNQVYDKIKML